MKQITKILVLVAILGMVATSTAVANPIPVPLDQEPLPLSDAPNQFVELHRVRPNTCTPAPSSIGNFCVERVEVWSCPFGLSRWARENLVPSYNIAIATPARAYRDTHCIFELFELISVVDYYGLAGLVAPTALPVTPSAVPTFTG